MSFVCTVENRENLKQFGQVTCGTVVDFKVCQKEKPCFQSIRNHSDVANDYYTLKFNHFFKIQRTAVLHYFKESFLSILKIENLEIQGDSAEFQR